MALLLLTLALFVWGSPPARAQEAVEEEAPAPSYAPVDEEAAGVEAASADEADAGMGSAPPALADKNAVDGFPGEGPLYDEFYDVAKDLRCPTCTGLSVLESDAKFSEQIKSIVKEQVQAGKSKDQIFQYFTERYGPWILRAPPKQGFNIVAWIFPIVLLIAGPPLVWFFVWRRRRQVATFGVRTSDAVLAEMQAELAALRAQRKGVTS